MSKPKNETPGKVTRMNQLNTGRQDLMKIDPKLIVISENFNPRDYNLPENREHLDSLKLSIKENGVLMPLSCWWDNEHGVAVLNDGECRLRACLELIEEGHPIVSVPVQQVDKGNDETRLILALQTNTGKPLSQWEVGAAYLKLVGYGWTKEQIAQKMGQKLTYINDAIEFAKAPKHIKDLLSQAAVSPALAKQTMKKHGDKATLVLTTMIEDSKKAAAARRKALDEKKAAREKAKAERAKTPAKKKTAKKEAPAKAEKPAKAPKAPAPLKREKKVTGKFLNKQDLKEVTAALEMCKDHPDSDAKLAVAGALKILQAKDESGDVQISLID